MPTRAIDANAKSEDRFGNNVAVTCPLCAKVYLASAFLQDKGGEKGKRTCPSCGRSAAFVSANDAYIEWPSDTTDTKL